MIKGIEGQFGSGKSSLAAKIARDVSLFNAKIIARKLNDSGHIVLSNIKMNKDKFPNYFYFEDDKFLEILRTVNLLNDVEREVYGTHNTKTGLTNYKRNKFTKTYIFYDEVGAIQNGRNYKEMDNVITEYINQNRKNFEDIYLITADGEQTDKSLRRHVESWYYVTPLSKYIPLLKNIGIVRWCIKDSDGQVKLKHYLSKDERGDYVTKSKPMDYYDSWFYKPHIWNYYDDLHKNIKDPLKYTGANIQLLQNIFGYKKELQLTFNKKFLPQITNQDIDELSGGSLPHSFTKKPLSN